MLRIVPWLIALILWASPAFAALTIDGTPQTNKVTRVTSQTVTLTWTGTNDLVCIVYGGSNPTTAVTVSSVTGGSLTFTTLAQPGTAIAQTITDGGGNKIRYEMWCAPATSPQSATTFTVNFSGTGPDSGAIFGFAINGQNTTTPVDINASLADVANNPAGVNTTVQVTGLSTTNANTMLIGIYVSGGDQPQTNGTGFALISGACVNDASGLTVDTTACVEEQVVSSTQSSATAQFGNATQVWAMGVTAIQQASGGGAHVNHFLPLMGAGN